MRLALHTWGSPDAGKTALLIHGVMSSYGTWVRVAPELAGRGYYAAVYRQGFLTSLEGWI